jgi:inner membrane protein
MPILIVAAMAGALLPDLDAAESKLKHLSVAGIKPFYLPALVIHRQLGHRGLAHSLAGLAIVSLSALSLAVWTGWQVPVALTLGYASHLLGDASTRSGVPLLYPNKNRYFLLPKALRFTTGSQAEEVLFPFLAILVLSLLLRFLLASSPLILPR